MKPTPMTSFRSVTTTNVMPPKTAPRVLSPTISLADDARLCNAALRRSTGACFSDKPLAWQTYLAENGAEVEAKFQRIQPLLSLGRVTREDIARDLGCSENTINYLLSALVGSKRVVRSFKNGRSVYTLPSA